MTKAQQLYNVAKLCMGARLVDDPTVDPSVGCAVSVNHVAKQAWGTPIGGGSSTAAMYAALQDTTKFLPVSDPQPGDVIISPTGTSTKGAPHGHVGIVGIYGVLSNNSMTGVWSEFYTIGSWTHYYHDTLGFPVLFFRPAC